MDDQDVPERLAGLVAMSSGDGRLDTLIRLTCGRALSLPPLSSEVDLIDGTSDREAVVAAFTEQFATDVSGIVENQRAMLVSALGKNVFRTTVAIFIADFVPRVWAGLGALAMGKPGNGGPVQWNHDTGPDRRAVERIRACGGASAKTRPGDDGGRSAAWGGAAQLPGCANLGARGVR